MSESESNLAQQYLWPTIPPILQQPRSLFLYITKVILYKTISTPFDSYHLQSQNRITIEELIAEESNKGVVHYLKTKLFRALKYVKNWSLSCIHPVLPATLNIEDTLIKCSSPRQCLLYNILRGLSVDAFHQILVAKWFESESKSPPWSESLAYELASLLSYPLEYAYINSMVTIYNNDNVQLGKYSREKLGEGFIMSSALNYAYDKLHIDLRKLFQHLFDAKTRKFFSKYTSLILMTVATYHFDTVYKRFVISNKRLKEYKTPTLDQRALLSEGVGEMCDKYGYWALFYGLEWRLVAVLLSELAVDAFDYYFPSENMEQLVKSKQCV
eukprot:145779_1